MRHVAVVVAGLALVLGCALWLVQQTPHRPKPVNLAVSLHASPGAFDDTTWNALRARPLPPPRLPCSIHPLDRGPVRAELLDITASLPHSVWVWRVADSYAGPVVIRGIEADGTAVAFQLPGGQMFAGETGDQLAGGGFPELDLIAPEYRFVRGAVSAQVEVRFPVLGCYALQVEGLGFSQREVLPVD